MSSVYLTPCTTLQRIKYGVTMKQNVDIRLYSRKIKSALAKFRLQK